MAAVAGSKSTRIAANSLLLAFDNLFGILGGVVASIIVARHFGPTLLGYYAFVQMLAMLTSVLAGRSGMALVCRKFLSEALQRLDSSGASTALRAITHLQYLVAGITTAVGLVAAFLTVQPDFRLVAVFAVLSVFPNLMQMVATGANAALEDFRSNVVASLVSSAVNFAGIGLTILLDGSLAGLTLALLVSRMADWVVRDAYRRRNWRPFMTAARDAVLPDDVRLALRRQVAVLFGQTAVLELLDLLVLERSEIFVLKRFSPIEQLAFFSVGFSAIQQLGSLARVLNIASATALIRQNVEDPSGAVRMTHALLRVIGLVVFPATMGVAVLSYPIIRLAYGERYLPAVPLLGLMGFMGWAGVLGQPIRAYVLATGRQAVMLRAMGLAAVLNLALALSLIPQWGAWGAVWSNGLTQVAALLLMAVSSSVSLPFRMNWGEMARLWAAAFLMAACVAPLSRILPPLAALLVGPPVGGAAYLILLRLLRALRPEDRSRLLEVGDRMPDVARGLLGRAVHIACP